MPPLSGVRVLDLGHYLAGPLAGMLLADQGAEVIKIDPPGPLRFNHPVNRILGRGKLHLRLDLRRTEHAQDFESLVRNSDVLIENFSPGTLARLGYSPQRLQALNPGLVCIALPGFAAEDERLADTQAWEGIIAAATGQFTDIHPVRQLFGLDPVYSALPLSSIYAGVHAATAAVLALRERRRGHAVAPLRVPLDAAARSAMSSIYLKIDPQPDRYRAPRLPPAVASLGLPLIRRWARRGPEAQRQVLNMARNAYPALMTSYRCGDGQLLYLFAIDNHRLVRRALDALQLTEPSLAEGLRFIDPYRAGDRRDNLAESGNLGRRWQSWLKQRIAERLLTRSAAAWETLLADAGVPCAVVRSTAQWLDLPALRAAGLTVDVPDRAQPAALRQPGVQVWLDTTLPTPSPERHLSRAADLPAREPRVGVRLADTRPPACWLDDIQAVDLCSMVAGPVAGRTLAEYGARVIKIDPPTPHHAPRMTCWYGVDVNPGKHSVLLDLRGRSGRGALDRLLDRSDVLLSNFTHAATDALQLQPDRLRARAPQLITATIGAFDGPLGGPWARRNGYDPVLQAASGIMHRYGDPGHPELHAIASCVDALTGYVSAFGIALALLQRDTRGVASAVGTSLAAAATLVQLPYAQAGGDSPAGRGGQCATGESPFYRLYAVRDGWLFLAAPEATLDDLPDALRPSDADASPMDAVARRLRRYRLSEALMLLRSAGLSAGAVNSVDALRRDPAATIGLQRRQIPGLGATVGVPGAQLTSDAGGLAILPPAEKPGGGTRRVLTALGLDADQMVAEGSAADSLAPDHLPR